MSDEQSGFVVRAANISAPSATLWITRKPFIDDCRRLGSRNRAASFKTRERAEARPADERMVALWLLSVIVWGAILRLWIIAGALAGVLCNRPKLHDIDIEGRVFNVLLGALAGAGIEALLWAAFASKIHIDQSEGFCA
jgi:hypothetical protein